MARKQVCVSKRPGKNPGQNSYIIRIWDETTGKYTTARTAASIAKELRLEGREYSPTSKAGALLIAQEFLKHGGAFSKKNDPLLADYCAEFWDWERSDYIQGRLARGLRIGREYCKNNEGFVKHYVQPAFPALRLSQVRPFHIERFVLSLKQANSISNRTINEVLHAVKVPLKEAHRLGLIAVNPAGDVQGLAEASRPKGIPTLEEFGDLVSLPDLDPRVRCAILLGGVCGLRLGEILAVRMQSVHGTTLEVASAWGKLDGLKSTKSGLARSVPLPQVIKEAMIDLATSNPHGPDGYIMYGRLPDEPCGREVLETGFLRALAMLTLGDKYGSATQEEKAAALQIWKDRNVSFHSLRHFANSELRGSVSDPVLRLLIGHNSAEMSDRYTHATESDLQALADAQRRKIIDKIVRIDGLKAGEA